MPLDRTAELVGEYRWIETRLYATLGAWVADLPLAGVQVHLDAQSMRHAWHAELLGDRLPVPPASTPTRLTRPSPATRPAVRPGRRGAGRRRARCDVAARGRGGPPPAGALPRLAGLYRVVLPRLVTTYTRHLRVTSPVADAPLRRALSLVLRDGTEDWLAGERLVQRLVTRPHDVAAVYGFQERLESVAVAAGAHSGLVDLPDWVPLDYGEGPARQPGRSDDRRG